MATDRARRSFDVTRMYRSIFSQRGQVTLEADANESEEIGTAKSIEDWSGASSRSVGIAIKTVVAIAVVSVAALIAVRDGGTGAATEDVLADEVDATGHEVGSSTTVPSAAAAASGASTTASSVSSAESSAPAGGATPTAAVTAPSTSAAPST